VLDAALGLPFAAPSLAFHFDAQLQLDGRVTI
jgi:hypothetical protein